MSDQQISKLPRGGHDYRKVYAAFDAASQHVGQPTVILAKTIKGWTIDALEGKNATHQMKKLTQDDLKKFRDRLYLPISDRDLERSWDETGAAPFFHPGRGLPRDRLHAGASFGTRRVAAQARRPGRASRAARRADVRRAQGGLRQAPGRHDHGAGATPEGLDEGSGIGQRIVPIAPDEYRTFGMDSMFPSAKVYNPAGQQYESVDRKLLLSYKESAQGQMLHEGISEAGAMASATAAGSAYSTHGEQMIPFYIFYSMFGFQRTGDSIWAMADQLARGFLIGATAGRTTLTGEGLQHADGHSPLLALSNPAVVHYDPAFAYEISHIMRSGLERMYGTSEAHPEGENVIFYLTVYNEPVFQPEEPATSTPRGSCAASTGYRLHGGDGPAVRILASGVAFPWAAEAARLLRDDWGVAAETWSVTSWNELGRDALAAEEWNLLHPDAEPRTAYVSDRLGPDQGPVIAVSDYMCAVPLQIARWVPGDFRVLGTDGFGFADTRPAARRYFHVDAESVVVQALQALADAGEIDRGQVEKAFTTYRIDDPTAVADRKQEGGDA